MTAADAKDVAALRSHPTAHVSDAMDLLGLVGGCIGLRPVWPGAPELCGPAFPVRFEPVDAGMAAPAGDYIDDVPAGWVVVIANGGRDWCTVWGGLLTLAGMRIGLAGAVIDGCCRDVAEAERENFPLYSRGIHLQSGKNRVALAAVGDPVRVGGVEVTAGDLVRADRDGVVVVPSARIDDVLAGAASVARTEAAIAEDISDGRRLDEARAARGYHRLAYRQPAP